MGEAGRGWGGKHHVGSIVPAFPLPVLVATPLPTSPTRGGGAVQRVWDDPARASGATSHATNKKAAVVAHGGLDAFSGALS